MKIVLVCIIICLITIIFSFAYLKISSLNRKNRPQKAEKNNKKAEYNKKCTYVFTKCREKSISSFNTDEEIEMLRIIANSYGITGIEEAKKCYKIGKKIIEEKESAYDNKILEENRMKDQREFEDIERKARIVGKDKYKPTLDKIYENALKNVNLVNDPKNDSNKNLEEQDVDDELTSAATTYNLLIQKELEKIETFNKKICDNTKMEEKFKNLEFTNLKCLVMKSKNVRVSGFVRIKKDLKLLGYNAMLDGAIKITILDTDGSELGFGYYTPGTYKDGLLVDSGFTKIGKRFSVICIIKDYKKIKEDVEYKYKIEPLNLWLIEC